MRLRENGQKTKEVFALFPVWCKDIDAYVWLEKVMKITNYWAGQKYVHYNSLLGDI